VLGKFFTVSARPVKHWYPNPAESPRLDGDPAAPSIDLTGFGPGWWSSGGRVV